MICIRTACMAVNYKKCFRTYENEKFDSKVTIVTDEDDDQSEYEEIVDIPPEEKKNQNKYTDWNKRDASKSTNRLENKSKVNGDRTENKQDFDLKLPSIKKVKPVKFVSKTWRTACVLCAVLCVGLMSVIGVLLWLMLSTKGKKLI